VHWEESKYAGVLKAVKQTVWLLFAKERDAEKGRNELAGVSHVPDPEVSDPGVKGNF